MILTLIPPFLPNAVQKRLSLGILEYGHGDPHEDVECVAGESSPLCVTGEPNHLLQ